MMETMTNEAIQVGAITVRFLVEAEQSGGSVTVFEFDVPGGTNLPAAHSHDGYDETIYGLDGVLTWTVEATPVEIGRGETLCIRRGAVHRFENTGDADATALAVVTPGILGPDYFRELAAIVASATDGP